MLAADDIRVRAVDVKHALDRERHIPLALNNDKVAALVAVFGELNKYALSIFVHNFPLRTMLGMR